MLRPEFLQLQALLMLAVDLLMLSVIKKIDFEDPVQLILFALCLRFTLFTYNIALGIAASPIAYPLTALAARRT